jgi:hypothetical protein
MKLVSYLIVSFYEITCCDGFRDVVGWSTKEWPRYVLDVSRVVYLEGEDSGESGD